MMFGQRPRFEALPDGTIFARAGTQMNCAGIAGIHVRITKLPSTGLICLPRVAPGDERSNYGYEVPGAELEPVFRTAVFRGATRAWEEYGPPGGAQFELLDALVHEVDANERRFLEAGSSAMRGWLEQNFGPRQKGSEDET